MSCREEHPTAESSAAPLRLQIQLRRISLTWYNNRRLRRAARNFVVREIRRQWFERRTQLKRRVLAWLQEFKAFRQSLTDLGTRHQKDHTSVTPDDWERAVAGNAKKMEIIYSKKFPKAKWPKDVPYLNFIALCNYKREFEHRNRQALDRAREAQSHKAKLAVLYKKGIEVVTRVNDYIRQHPASTPDNDSELSMRLVEQRTFHEQQQEKQLDLLRKSREDPASVSWEEWELAIVGTSVLKRDPTIAGYFELARRRMAGEKCDGWANGMYLGPTKEKE